MNEAKGLCVHEVKDSIAVKGSTPTGKTMMLLEIMQKKEVVHNRANDY